MKKQFLITLMVLSVITFSCKKGQIKPEAESINTDLLTTKTRHVVKAVLINKSGLESSISDAWQDCAFQSSYKFNEDSSYFQKDACLNDSLISHWEFKENKTKIYISYDNIISEYLILKLTEEELKLELLSDNMDEYQTVYTYQ
ncbi:MAG: hypothetical protein L3J35_06845 [Bacteroidales bacterium]|nr:hypothetical protein [Bacteroidales bacterium]